MSMSGCLVPCTFYEFNAVLNFEKKDSPHRGEESDRIIDIIFVTDQDDVPVEKEIEVYSWSDLVGNVGGYLGLLLGGSLLSGFNQLEDFVRTRRILK